MFFKVAFSLICNNPEHVISQVDSLRGLPENQNLGFFNNMFLGARLHLSSSLIYHSIFQIY